MSQRVQESPFRETEWDQRLDRMLDDLKTTVGSDTEMATDGRSDNILVSSFRSSSRNEGRSSSRSGSRAGQVEDGGHVRHTRQEYRTPDNQTQVVTEKYEYDTGDTSKSKHYQKKVMKSTYSNFNNMSAGSLEDPPPRPAPQQISPPAPVDTKGIGTLTNGAPTSSYEVDDMIADNHKPGEVRRIVWRNRFEKTYETQDSSQPPPTMTIEEESRRRDLMQRHHTTSTSTTSNLSSPPRVSPGSHSWKEPIPMPTPPQLSPREPGVAYIYTYGGQQGGTGVQPLPPLNYVNVPGPQSVPPSEGAPSPTPSSQLQTQPIIYHYSYHYTIQPGQQPPDGVPLPPGGTLPSSPPALQGTPGSQTHMHVSHLSHSTTQCNHPDHPGHPGHLCNHPDHKGHPVHQCNHPDQKGHPSYLCNHPDHKGHPVNQCNHPDHKGHPVFLCNHPDHKGHPVYQCNHPDHKGYIDYPCNHPDHKGHPVYQCNHPDHKSYIDYPCNHPDHKGHPVYQCNHPDHKGYIDYPCNHPDHKGHPVYRCNHPDHKGYIDYPCNHPDHKGHPVYQCSHPDHKSYLIKPTKPGEPSITNYNVHSYSSRSTTSTVNRNETPTMDQPGGPRPRDGPGSPTDDPGYPRKPTVPVRSPSPSGPDGHRGPGQPGINITINKTTTTRTVHSGDYPGSPEGSDVPPVTSTPYSSRGRSVSPEPRIPNTPHHITYHTNTHVSRDPHSDSLDRVRRPRNDTLPFPDTSPIKGNNKNKIPRRVDDLMTSFSDSEDGGPSAGGVPRRDPNRRGDPADHEPLLPHNNQVAVRADADAKANAEVDVKRDLTMNKTGPPVYYPPGHELFHETMHTMTLKDGGRRGKAKWRMEKSSGHKESSSSSEAKGGMTMVPLCLPLCCGAACVIM